MTGSFSGPRGPLRGAPEPYPAVVGPTHTLGRRCDGFFQVYQVPMVATEALKVHQVAPGPGTYGTSGLPQVPT